MTPLADELVASPPVPERVPQNLATLYEAFTREGIEGLFSGEVYEYDGVEFVCQYAPGSTAERFHIVKPLEFVHYFVDFLRGFEGARILELGIAEGGSTALAALVARPAKLVAIDLEPQPLAALDDFRAARGLSDVIRPYYGVDQTDRARLVEILSAELGDEPLDLVLDDASHQLGPTRASFECLFPRLRPGGIYTIEDWHADQRFLEGVGRALRELANSSDAGARAQLQAALAERSDGARSDATAPKLSVLAHELVLACASTDDAIDEVTFNDHWIMVRRGPAELDPDDFRLSERSRDYFGFVRRETSS